MITDIEAIIIRPGDLFIYKSKHGFVKGIVKSCRCISTIRTEYSACIKIFVIDSTNNVTYKLSEIEIVSRYYSEDECIGLDKAIDRLNKAKKSLYK